MLFLYCMCPVVGGGIKPQFINSNPYTKCGSRVGGVKCQLSYRAHELWLQNGNSHQLKLKAGIFNLVMYYKCLVLEQT